MDDRNKSNGASLGGAVMCLTLLGLLFFWPFVVSCVGPMLFCIFWFLKIIVIGVIVFSVFAVPYCLCVGVGVILNERSASRPAYVEPDFTPGPPPPL